VTIAVDRLANHCHLITKGTTPTSVGLAFVDKGVPFLRVGNVSHGSVNYMADTLFIDFHANALLRRSQIVPGDVLLSIAGTIGRAGVVPVCAPAMNCNQALAIIRTRESVNRHYLRYWLESRQAQAQMAGATVTGTIQNLSLTQVGELRIPLPPLPEQRRIAAILDQADALRAKRREALAQLDSLTQSIFIEMFGDPASNPQGCPEVTIGDLCEVKGGKRLPKGADYAETPTQFRYIRVTDIRSGSVDETKLVYLKPEVQSTISRYIVNTGDVIISIAGSIGLIAPVPPSLAGANLTENAAKIVPRANAPRYDPVFLAKALQTPFAQDQISSHVGQVTIGKLALFRIEKLRLPLPPIEAQRRFARITEAVARLKQSHEASAAEANKLFASLQHHAFTGQLS
jgi:type I restriction enzyme S subunit